MPLTSGFRLGPYEILLPIGAGGMGEVYRAKDTRLGRTVAVKVLPSQLSSSPEFRQRFEREARTISQLSHPHICALYDVGHQDGVDYLVMEYLEGETLAERLAKGPLPLEQTLRYGMEIADALDKAHRSEVIHRDLKPGNVMVTKSGVKLLDFGLAKALAPVSAASQFTALPTQASPITREGSLLGTLQYMAPEQLEGKQADARTDIFAFGAVLYEMATGKKTFSGATQASLIGSILRDEPRAISEVAPLTPRALDRLVRICLAKDPDDRWQTAHDVGLQLREIERDRAEPAAAIERAAPRRTRAAIAAWIVAVAAISVAVYTVVSSRQAKQSAEVVRSLLLPPPNTEFRFLDASSGTPAVSPDGKRIAFSATNADDQTFLWVRALDSLESFAIPGTSGAYFPFWSPDGRSLGFFAEGKLKIVEASTAASAPVSLADVTEARGGTWGVRGDILYAPAPRTAIFRVSASGGSPAPVTQSGQGETQRWPVFLPGGRRFLYTARLLERREQSAIYAASLDSKERREILRAHSDVAYSPPGYLLFHRSGRLMAVRFDADRAAVQGQPDEVVNGIDYFPATGKSVFSAGQNVLTYAPSSDARLCRLAWFDRTGREVGHIGTTGMYLSPRLSPDGRRLAVSMLEQLAVPPDIWLFDTRLGTGTRLTQAEMYVNLNPVFSPDGARIVFSSSGGGGGGWNVFTMSASGTGEPEPLLAPSNPRWSNDISPDGRFLLYRELSPTSRGDLKVLPLSGERRPRNFVASNFDEDQAVFSPDGRRVAYVSEESGRKEVFVVRFPDPTDRLRISSEGGIQPRWSRDGRELYFVSGGRTMMAASFDATAGGVPTGPPRRLFDAPIQPAFGTNAPFKYDVAPDGRFLIVVRASKDPPPPLVLVLNWQAGLKK